MPTRRTPRAGRGLQRPRPYPTYRASVLRLDEPVVVAVALLRDAEVARGVLVSDAELAPTPGLRLGHQRHLATPEVDPEVVPGLQLVHQPRRVDPQRNVHRALVAQ